MLSFHFAVLAVSLGCATAVDNCVDGGDATSLIQGVGAIRHRSELALQTGDTCAIGDHVSCGDDADTMCAGDQCCPDGSTCPSAENSFSGCPSPKVVELDCTQTAPVAEAPDQAEAQCPNGITWTPGTCAYLPCWEWRGDTECVDGQCVCAPGGCPNSEGKCVRDATALIQGLGAIRDSSGPALQTGYTCAVGDHVSCGDDADTHCAGDQCCPDGSTCPSADNSFSGCPSPKVVELDCTQTAPVAEAPDQAEAQCPNGITWTPGTCAYLPCWEWRGNTECVDGQCVCAPGGCPNSEGKCV